MKTTRDAVGGYAIAMSGPRGHLRRVRVYLAHGSDPTNVTYGIYDGNTTGKNNVVLTDCSVKVDGDYANQKGIYVAHDANHSWSVSGLRMEYGSGAVNNFQLLYYASDYAVITNISSIDGIDTSTGIEIVGDRNQISNISHIDITVSGDYNALANIGLFAALFVASGANQNQFTSITGSVNVEATASNNRFSNSLITFLGLNTTAENCIFNGCTIQGILTLSADNTIMDGCMIIILGDS